MRGRPGDRRRGLSLLEVILAIAILGAAMVLIAELVRLGYRSATRSKRLSEAQLLCDGTMAEISAGSIPLESASGVSVPEHPDWVYYVDVQAAEIPGLLRVTASVEQSLEVTSFPVRYSLVRLVPDPDYDPTMDDPIPESGTVE